MNDTDPQGIVACYFLLTIIVIGVLGLFVINRVYGYDCLNHFSRSRLKSHQHTANTETRVQASLPLHLIVYGFSKK